MSTRTKIKDVQDAVASLEQAHAAHARAKDDYASVKSLGGQQGYQVVVNGVRIDVASMHPHTYQGTMIRGREMIHLGALKALQSIVDGWSAEVARRRGHLRDVATSFAEGA